MIWLTWRQFRTQAVVAAAALTALAIYLVVLGLRIRHDYSTDILGCQPANCESARRSFADTYGGQVSIVGALLIGVPALIGIFWGAPLITRELEEKTDRLVWNQTVTRTRWLAVKLTLLALAGVVVVGLFSLLLTWSASRYDQLEGGRFGALAFASRNIVPIGYAVFAFVLGAVVGLLVRRTLPAMAITLAVFAAVQILVPALIRTHLMPAVTSAVPLDATAISRADFFGADDHETVIGGYTAPGAWSLTAKSQLFNADGSPYTGTQMSQCGVGDPQAAMACTARQNLHFSYTYQPADRYWPFQWIELSGFLVLAGLLTGFGFWRIRTYSG